MRTSSSRSPIKGRTKLAIVAVPTAMALGITLLPNAGAQSSGSSNGSSLSDAFAPSAPVERTPIETTYPDVEGLPEGVDINRVEYLSPRHVMVYIKSAAMPDKEQKVQIQLARDWYSNPQATFPEVWALDGLRARDDESGWTIETNILNQFASRNVNVIMPVGGESSFYSDWQKPDQGTHYMWETFLTKELVPILDNEFRSNQRRALTGISMGGTAAMNLAERHPYLFDFVASFSGYLDTTTQGMPQAIMAAQLDAGGYSTTNMWGPEGSQDWIDHDPKLGIENLKDMTVYVSAGSGKDDYGIDGSVAKGPANIAGIGLEAISRMSSQTFVDYAKRAGVEPIVRFRPSGVHSWEYWQYEMDQAWPHIANALEIPEADRGANCAPAGAIAQAVKNFETLECLNDEYVTGGDGRAQDFTADHTAYWSPDTGAHVLFGRINTAYAGMGGANSWLGFPKTGEITAPDGKGRFVHFEHGSIYWTAQTGAHPIPADMMGAWGKNGYEKGDLKYPTSAPRTVGEGLVQEFQGGILTRNPDGSHAVVHGAIGAKYKELGAAESELGFPVGGERAIKGGFFQEFDNGNIYWSAASGAHYILKGNIFNAWGAKGYEQGEYGWPTADFATIPAGGLEQKFQNGTIREVFGRIQEDKN
ncbi:alpha/beta hydrolase-fold protein [Corynebacterium endometrii]|uniref:Diacylglycerol acyltransferase/mycolyltransferase Ag85C n=1 Tax=Corynebacterium endometrii TaxID=2488819 RepID=A0A4P7QI25_9CORY|nr:alpha/beta hydrolase-fold protein [Corynebacterium endometrii]QCB29372.1 Diacylglycerol acyltransferase/mycolyltransferase Ag85C precursor [Corynebacterium endometrii]